MAIRLGVLAVFATLLGAVPAAAQNPPYAPLDQPPPRLQVPADELSDSLSCTGDLAGAPGEPILLVHGTALTPDQFDWNYVPALLARGRALCTVALKEDGTADIQLSAERVVFAIRAMHRRARGPIDVVGHSQGGMIPRWALRFFPDTRAMVDDLVGLAASNHGTLDSEPCDPSACPASFHQQAASAEFIEALNSRTETFAGIDYTAVYTRTDEVVTPNLNDGGSSSLRGGGANVTNVAVQDVCPADPAEHLAVGTYDATSYALARDALDNDGPADPARVDRAVCSRLFMPGVDATTFPTDLAQVGRQAVVAGARAERIPQEPPLECYVTAACPERLEEGGPQLALTRRCIGQGRLRVRLAGDTAAVRDVNVKLDKRLVARDTAAPFERVISRRTLGRTSAERLRAVAYLRDGEPFRVILSRSLPRCGL